MPVPVAHGQPQQSILQKLGMGAAMGGAVGMTLGFLFGGYSIITRGAGPRGPLNTLATYMMSSGGTFAFFMSIGSVIRTETQSSYSSSQLSLAQANWKARQLIDQTGMSRESHQREVSRPVPRWDRTSA